MLDWLRRDPQCDQSIEIGDRSMPVVIRRHPRAKRMTLRLSPDGREVRLSIPQWGRTAEALEFAHSRKTWLAEQLALIPTVEAIRHGVRIPFRGVEVSIDHSPVARRKPALAGDSVSVGGPEHSLESRLRRWLEREAQGANTDDLAEYCRKAGRDAPRLGLSRARRRWGSCAPDGSIRINWRLIMAPDFVRRSVVAHEVAHLVHFDHSPHFHELLSEIYEGDIKAANSWLKRHGRSLYLPFG